MLWTVPSLSEAPKQSWQGIWIGLSSYCFFLNLVPVSSENVDPNMILLITFKLIVDVCQNIRYNVPYKV